jgi:hypothetical protein
LQRADDLGDLALKMQETTEAVQRLDFVSQQAAGHGVERLMEGMVDLERNLADVGSESVKNALNELNVSASEFAAMSVHDKVYLIAESFQEARKRGTGMKAVMDLMGDAARDLTPLFSQSKESLDKLFERSGEHIISDSDIAMAAKLNDEFDAMVSKVSTLGKGLALDFAEGFEFLRSGLDVDQFIEKTKQEAIASKSANSDAGGDSAASDAAALQSELKAAERIEKAATELDKIKKSLADAEFELLPDAEKVTQFDQRMKALLAEMKAKFPFFDESIGGVADLAAFQEEDGNLEGAKQSLTLLKELRDLARKRHDAQGAIDEAAAEKASDAADASRKKNEESLRDQVKRQESLVREGSIADARGTAAGAIEQIFGRDASQLQLAATKAQTAKLEMLQKTLEKIQAQGEQEPLPLEIKIK